MHALNQTVSKSRTGVRVGLSEKEVATVRQMREDGLSYDAIARRLGISTAKARRAYHDSFATGGASR